MPRTMSPGVKSVNLYGPVPTGFKLFGASRDLAPLYASNKCLGMIEPCAPPTNGIAQNGVTLSKVIFTVWLSTASTFMSLYEPIDTAAVAGSEAYCQLKTTSAEVKGLPSCQVTPRFSFHTTVLPSLDRPPFAAEGISAARFGIRLPSLSQLASGS